MSGTKSCWEPLRGARPRWTLGAWCAAALLWLAPAAAAQVQESPRVTQLAVSGNRYVPEAEILAVVTTRVGDELSPEKLRADRRAIQELGYFRSVGSPTARVREREASVTFRVTELPLVLHVRILGNTLVSQAELRDRLQTRVGVVLSLPRVLEDVAAIQAAYRERGFVAQVSETLLDEAARSGIVRFEIVELVIGEVRFEGADERLQRRLREALQEVPGNPYQPAAVARDARRLRAIRGVDTARARAELLENENGGVAIVWYINTPPPPRAGDPEPPAASATRSSEATERIRW